MHKKDVIKREAIVATVYEFDAFDVVDAYHAHNELLHEIHQREENLQGAVAQDVPVCISFDLAMKLSILLEKFAEPAINRKHGLGLFDKVGKAERQEPPVLPRPEL